MRNRARIDRRGLIFMGAALPALALGACQLPGQSAPPRQFRVTPKTTFDELPQVDWALAVDRPTVDRSIDTNRIARVSGVEVEFYADAAWVDRPPAMIQPLIIQSFRSSGAIAVVTDRRSEVRPDFMLQTDIIAFQALQVESGPPEARVVMSAKLIAMPRRDVVGTTEIGRTVPAAAGDLPAIVAAFDDALGKVLKRLVEWTLVTGKAGAVAT
ncbi:MAG TPA: ABC-type transport auxiliary lipoprotein family protein [Geminicoccaceae bacterium]|jgi:cholesterol transport system auxiliary component|nr:ABC-type transport auxiliary lipoprotein family protein [Geminicoccaceae bacterium]